ncbi:hypothetical protein H311_04657 [Anncaliia algerae PRA109]|nr:hypothetical protein H311_04657 [Anncaliia algerae PRA109]
MTEVMKVGSRELQEIFYERGIEGKLPKECESFKTFIVEYCTEQSLSSNKKFKDETWYE